MDFLDPNKKSAHIRQLFIGYVLVAVAVAFATLILLFQSYGYDLDRRTGKVIQNGLLFISAKPDPAAIYLNGVLNKSRTDTKLTIPAGQYAIELKRDGYQTWRRSLSLDGGSVERLTYPLLIPNKLVTSDVQLYGASPAYASTSLDNHWLLVLRPGSISSFDNFDLSTTAINTTELVVPNDLLTAAAGEHQLTVVEWAADDRHILMKHSFAGTSEFVVVDREALANSYNLTRVLGAVPTNVRFYDGKSDQFSYTDSAQQLVTYDAKAKLTKVIMKQVISYDALANDAVAYTAPLDATTGAGIGVRLWDGTNSYSMRNFPVATSATVLIRRYAGDTYVAVQPQNDNHVYIYRNALSSLKQAKDKVAVPISVLKIEQTGILSFSPNGRFVTSQMAGKFAVYDSETDRRYYFDLKVPLTEGATAQWLDGYRMTIASNNTSVVFDYDGANQQPLGAISPGFSPVLNRDSTALLSIAPSTIVPNRTALIRTELKVK